MRGRWWLLLFYAPLAAWLCLATGDLWWLLWAFLIALAPTTVVVLSGHSRDWTARRRFRQFSELADRLGARDGVVIRESRRRFNVIMFDPGLNVQTHRPGTEEEVRKVLFAKAVEAGFRRFDDWTLRSADYRLALTIHLRTDDRWTPIPEGHVVTEINIDSWKGGKPGDKPLGRRRSAADAGNSR